MLVAMATGTGKTNLAIALLYRLLKTKRFRRICSWWTAVPLVCKAADAFKTAHGAAEDLRRDLWAQRAWGHPARTETKVQIGTIQCLVKRVLFAKSEETPLRSTSTTASSSTSAIAATCSTGR